MGQIHYENIIKIYENEDLLHRMALWVKGTCFSRASRYNTRALEVSL
ncbi:hypothetical protein SAMN02745176_01403 [Lutispora thermophila DSM 19022]|uniref:Uncharacterized protein n=1 Tax=Lutispora thermophila DSM 19022 TaxID=1122184 RepID=A0A1M6E404_9FIRM|nr:hypothetical protein SAMN02745176_01403 [Lutispora thermophila DSM 19022]